MPLLWGDSLLDDLELVRKAVRSVTVAAPKRFAFGELNEKRTL
jgi:hypothetical protein